jgi:PHD/YefM family antitoxin component YafN of YafNO toxin-antitoxin module
VNPNEHVEHEQRKAATRTRSVALAERKARAVELRRSGLTFESIAAALNCSRTRAFELVKSALKTVVQTPTEALRDEALRRLETMWDQTLAIWSAAEPLIQNGAPVMLAVTDSDGQPVINMKTNQPLVMPAVDKRLMLQVTDRLLRIEESRRKLLGIDQPQRVEVAGDPSAVVQSMDQERLERALAEGLRRLRAPQPEVIDVTSVERGRVE